MSDKSLSSANEQDTPRFKDEQTDKRMHEHINNEKDIISEEDIRNVRTDIGLQKMSETDADNELTDNGDVDMHSSSWNLLENSEE